MSWHDPLPSAGWGATSNDQISGSEPQQSAGQGVGQSAGDTIHSIPAPASDWVQGESGGWGDSGGVAVQQVPVPNIVEGVPYSPESPAGPPLLWLGLAALLAAAGIVVFFIGNGATMGVIGWLLAGPLAIGALGVFIVVDAKRAETGWYRPSPVAAWGRRAVVVLALVGVSLNAFLIANDVARGIWQ